MKYEVFGKELKFKTVRKAGSSGIIYVDKNLVDKPVAIIDGIYDIDNVLDTIGPRQNRQISYSYYVLDLVHKGHLEQMRNAKAAVGPNGISIVGILTTEAVLEKKPTPLLTFDERIELARSIKYNDIVIGQDTYSPIKNILRTKPDIIFESASHKREDIAEVTKIADSYGAKVIETPYYPGISSTELKHKMKVSVNE